MTKAEKVIKYYVLCNKLKTVIRTGWKVWHVNKERIESVAEHIYGVQMLAIAMKSEYDYDINLEKILMMLAVHELGEINIGDITQFQDEYSDKASKEHAAVHKILEDLLDGEQIEKLFLEFDEKKTPEARFAYQCDKLECDLQSKLYGEDDVVDLTKQDDNKAFHNKTVQRLLNEYGDWATMWLKFGQETYSYDKNFMEVSEYAVNNRITK